MREKNARIVAHLKRTLNLMNVLNSSFAVVAALFSIR
jgi:hypothetical protein